MEKEKMKKTILEKYWVIILVVFVILMPILIPDIRHDLLKEHIGSFPELEKDFLSIYITFLGVIGVLGTLMVNFLRLNKQDNQLNNQQKQIEIQNKSNNDQRFSLAIETLGSNAEATRIGAIHSLFHLAKEDERYTHTVVDIMTSYIKSVTDSDEYQQVYFGKKFNDVQLVIDLLFKEEGLCYLMKPNTKLIDMKKANLSNISFENAYLNYVDFDQCKMFHLNLSESIIYNCKFSNSQLDYISFNDALVCQSDFSASKLQSCYFNSAAFYECTFLELVISNSVLANTYHSKCTYFETSIMDSNVNMLLNPGQINGLKIQARSIDSICMYKSIDIWSLYFNRKRKLYPKVNKIINKVFEDLKNSLSGINYIRERLLQSKNIKIENNISSQATEGNQ